MPMPADVPALFLPADPRHNLMMDSNGRLWQVWPLPSGGELRVPLNPGAPEHSSAYLQQGPGRVPQGGGFASSFPLLDQPYRAHDPLVEPVWPIEETEVVPYTER